MDETHFNLLQVLYKLVEEDLLNADFMLDALLAPFSANQPCYLDIIAANGLFKPQHLQLLIETIGLITKKLEAQGISRSKEIRETLLKKIECHYHGENFSHQTRNFYELIAPTKWPKYNDCSQLSTQLLTQLDRYQILPSREEILSSFKNQDGKKLEKHIAQYYTRGDFTKKVYLFKTLKESSLQSLVEKSLSILTDEKIRGCRAQFEQTNAQEKQSHIFRQARHDLEEMQKEVIKTDYKKRIRKLQKELLINASFSRVTIGEESAAILTSHAYNLPSKLASKQIEKAIQNLNSHPAWVPEQKNFVKQKVQTQKQSVIQNYNVQLAQVLGNLQKKMILPANKSSISVTNAVAASVISTQRKKLQSKSQSIASATSQSTVYCRDSLYPMRVESIKSPQEKQNEYNERKEKSMKVKKCYGV